MASELPDEWAELSGECCAKCRFWDWSMRTSFMDEDGGSRTAWGPCRRFPPVSPVGDFTFDLEGEPELLKRPLVPHDEWCGEFQPVKPA